MADNFSDFFGDLNELSGQDSPQQDNSGFSNFQDNSQQDDEFGDFAGTGLSDSPPQIAGGEDVDKSKLIKRAAILVGIGIAIVVITIIAARVVGSLSRNGTSSAEQQVQQTQVQQHSQQVVTQQVVQQPSQNQQASQQVVAQQPSQPVQNQQTTQQVNQSIINNQGQLQSQITSISSNGDGWVQITGDEDIKFNSQEITGTFTITGIKNLAKVTDNQKNLALKTVLTGSISGFVGTYELEIPFNIGRQLSVGNSFSVGLVVGQYNGKVVVTGIRYL